MAHTQEHRSEEEEVIIYGAKFRCLAEAVMEMTRTLNDPRVLPSALRRANSGQDGGAYDEMIEARGLVIDGLRAFKHAIDAVLDQLQGSVDLALPGDTEPHPAPGDEPPES